jgi:hypothetical protein
MKEFPSKPDGEFHFEKVKKNIPSHYWTCVKNIEYVQGGRVYERILEQIIKKALPDSKIDKPSPIFEVKRGKKHGGYLKPDLQINNNVFIEVTTWGDSNMIFSKIMQGYLLKKNKYPNAKYYVVIADLGIDSWTWNDKEEFWEKWSEIGDVTAVDGWFGFRNIDELVDRIKVLPI